MPHSLSPIAGVLNMVLLGSSVVGQCPDEKFVVSTTSGALFPSSIDLDGEWAIAGEGKVHEVHFFRKETTGWALSQSEGRCCSQYGHSVALDGNRAVISTGAGEEFYADVWVLQDGTWEFEQRLIPPDVTNPGAYGNGVDILGSVIAVSHPYEVDGGVVHLWTHDGAVWNRTFVARPANSSPMDDFGSSRSGVVLTDSLLVVGSRWYDSNLGAVHVFRRDPGILANDPSDDQWFEEQKLSGSDTAGNSQFGFSLSVYGNEIAVGAIALTQAYIFEYDGNTWQETQVIPSFKKLGTNFGGAVDLDANRLLVGDNRADGVEDVISESGLVYEYERLDGLWAFKRVLIASDKHARDLFGAPVVSDGDTVMVGALGESTPPTTQQGAVYFLDCAPPVIPTINGGGLLVMIGAVITSAALIVRRRRRQGDREVIM